MTRSCHATPQLPYMCHNGGDGGGHIFFTWEGKDTKNAFIGIIFDLLEFHVLKSQFLLEKIIFRISEFLHSKLITTPMRTKFEI